jgi:predicted metal-dependent HD superfamily phosphohydrolase
LATGSAGSQGMAKKRFQALWKRCLLAGAASDGVTVFQELKKRYSEPHRYYHTPNHISHCLREFDLATELMDDADAIEMGLWFHDAIYDPRASNNELKSAELFTACAGDRMDADFRRRVYDLILITIHPEKPRSPDQEFMVDIDLSSFGLPWPAFRRDSNAVRNEYAHLSDKQFYPAQIRFLRSLLARPTFFFTEFFRNRYEETAERNIARHIDELGALGYS